MGRWYEQARDKDFLFERGTCSFAEYAHLDNGHVSVANSEKRSGKFTVANADAVFHDDSGQAYLDVSFSKLAPSFPYQVLDTDYETYSIIYGCGGLSSLFSVENVWIMTRDQVASDDLLATLKGKVTEILPQYDQDEFLSMTPQGGDCSYPNNVKSESINRSRPIIDLLNKFLQ